MAKKRKSTTRRSVKTKRRRTSQARKRNVQSFIKTLSKLKRLRPAQQYQALRVANNIFLRKFVANVKKLRHAKLSPKLRKRVMQKAPQLRVLVKRGTGLSKQRKMLTQRGGILPLLLAALPAIGSVAGSIIQAAT